MDLKTLQFELMRELEDDILPFWASKMIDPDGGFFGRMDSRGKIVPQSPKGGILNARILWTFAAAYRAIGKKEYLDTAIRAKRELIDRFYDHDFSGIYWSLDSYGKPLDTKKQIYSIAFTIYALSQMYCCCGDEESLKYAVKLFEDIEIHSFDHIKNGYIEAFCRDWSPIEDMRLSDKDQNSAKTMNTHLHILEGYTSLYRVWKNENLAVQLKNLIKLFLDKIILPSGHLALFFDEDWNCTSHVASYGHDIECSWLLAEAAEVLGDKILLDRVNKVCAHIAEASLEGWSQDGGMIYERDLNSGNVDGSRHWWVQAETVMGSLWQWRNSSDPKWLERACCQWEFIKKNLLCPDGEWYWSLNADGTVNNCDDRAGFWKCPYHNGRMSIEAASF